MRKNVSFKFVVDPDLAEWLNDFDKEFDFDLVPDGPPTQGKSTCASNIHHRNTTPIALPEKQFQQWYVCKICGTPLKKAGS